MMDVVCVHPVCNYSIPFDVQVGMIGAALCKCLASIPLLCLKEFRETELKPLSALLHTGCAMLVAGLTAQIPGLKQAVNTCWLSIGER